MTTTRRNSRQRTLVYQVVKDSHSHPNAEEVYLLVRRQLPDISLGTVYRNLNLLVEMGLLHRIYTGMGADRFDAVVTAHPHLICSSGGGVFDLECQVERETAQLKQAFERSGATSTKFRFEPGEFATVANKIIRKKMNINHNFKKKGGFRV